MRSNMCPDQLPEAYEPDPKDEALSALLDATKSLVRAVIDATNIKSDLAPDAAMRRGFELGWAVQQARKAIEVAAPFNGSPF